MSYDKKGFTLIELLAIIVILALIALIAVPILLNILDGARKGAFKDSAYGIVEATKLNLLSLTTSNQKITYPVMYSYKDGKLYDSLGNEISMSGGIVDGEGKVIYHGVNEFELAVYDEEYCGRYTNTSKEVEVSKLGEGCRLSYEEGIIVYDLNVLNLESGASLISNRYDTERISVSAQLPNLDSAVIYEVKISNYSDILYDLSNIVIENDSNESIQYEIIGIEKGDMIEPNTSKVFNIKLFYQGSILPSNIVESLTLKFEFEEHISSYVVDAYEYSGDIKTFVAPYTGLYKIELWGASGGYFSNFVFGKGAYTVGTLLLEKNDQLYVTVGGQGSTAFLEETMTNGGYNGGGKANFGSGTGGGATDVRFGGTLLNDRIMVAAGGGGTGSFTENSSGGSGGTFVGYNGGSHYNEEKNGRYGGSGGTQISGGLSGEYWTGEGREGIYLGTNGLFGIGGTGGYELEYENGAGAGGGGYYGGGAGSERNGGGAGGSSFVSGHAGCVAITSATDLTPLIQTNDSSIDISYSYHYSGKIFIETKMVSGNEEMPSYDGKSIMIGNTGDGFAKITFIERIYK